MFPKVVVIEGADEIPQHKLDVFKFAVFKRGVRYSARLRERRKGLRLATEPFPLGQIEN
jgi:hypothetical protein